MHVLGFLVDSPAAAQLQQPPVFLKFQGLLEGLADSQAG